jgi:hypothetical protein
VVKVEFWNLEYVIRLPRNRTHSFAVVAEKKRRREIAVRKKKKKGYKLFHWKNCAFLKATTFLAIFTVQRAIPVGCCCEGVERRVTTLKGVQVNHISP